MGLDMTLSRKTYVGNKYKDKTAQLIVKAPFPKTEGVDFDADQTAFQAIKQERVSEVEEEIMYWRKANHIHGWFVRNVQKGVDDCGEYLVSKEELTQLLDLVQTVLADHSRAEELLPPMDGFFFGARIIDDWYFEDLEKTKVALAAILSENSPYSSLYYSSSW